MPLTLHQVLVGQRSCLKIAMCRKTTHVETNTTMSAQMGGEYIYYLHNVGVGQELGMIVMLRGAPQCARQKIESIITM